MKKKYVEKLSKKQHIQVFLTFCFIFGFSVVILKNANDLCHFDVLQLQKILFLFLLSSLVTQLVAKIFYLKNHNAIIEAERLTCLEYHLAIEEAMIWTESAVDGTITFANPRFCRILGYSQTELEGQNHRILKSNVHSPEFYEDIWQTISNGKVWRGEICNRTKDGNFHWFNTVLVPVFENDTKKIKKYIGIRNDITVEKFAEDEAKQLQKQLFQVQKLDSIGQLTGGIAHDFNNILMGITGYTSLVGMINSKNENSFDRNKIETYLQGIEKCSETATNLIEKMLVYCREYEVIEPIEIEPSVIILDEVMEMLRSTISRCITLDFIATETPNIIIDPTQLHQILVNLVINAHDAIESEKIQGAITVSLSYEEFDTYCDAFFDVVKGWFVVIGVHDNGSGMDDEKITHIFDPFFTTKDVGKGTGLGLSVISGIVGQAGGHILVDSQVGKGSRFRILFPPAHPKHSTAHSS